MRMTSGLRGAGLGSREMDYLLSHARVQLHTQTHKIYTHTHEHSHEIKPRWRAAPEFSPKPRCGDSGEWRG
jgi:hypothetical protein